MARQIYLDWAATTPLREEVKKIIKKNFGLFANPSSIHTPGRTVRNAIEKARAKIAQILYTKPEEIIFTSGATESCNLAIKGTAFSALERGIKPHIITSAFEHHAVLEPVEWLEKKQIAEISIIRPEKDGIVDPVKIEKAIRKNTVLVSIMMVNNEIGTIQPIEKIGKIIKRLNRQRQEKILFHTDATQAVPYLETIPRKLRVHLLSFSGHKIGGPKGIGVLYCQKEADIEPIILGGKHEFGKRAGTENVLGILGLAKALELTIKEREKENKRVQKLRDWFEKKVLENIPESQINGAKTQRSPHISNLYLGPIEAEAILVALDTVGVSASAGSACTAEDLGPSHVLMSIFSDQKRADGSVRFSFGWETNQEELEKTVEVLTKIVRRIRKIAGKE